MVLTQEDLLSIGTIIADKINPLIDSVNSLDQKVTSLEQNVTSIRTKIGTMEARQANSVKGREDQLVIVPNNLGEKPTTIAYPYCVAQLVVAGSEGIPGMAERSWSAEDSDRLLAFYGEELSGSESSGDEGERKKKKKERGFREEIGCWTLGRGPCVQVLWSMMERRSPIFQNMVQH